METVSILIISLIALVFITLGVLKIISMMKGKLEINLPNFNFSAGETITGTLVLKLKKPLEAESLMVGLIAESSSNKGIKGSKSTQTVYSFNQPVSGKKVYPSGESTYDFKIKVPANVAFNSTGNEIVDGIIKSVQILGGISSVRWYVTSELEISGMNLSKRVQINIG